MTGSNDRSWLQDFENLMRLGKFTEGKELKNQFFPSKLYKYRSLNDNALKNILDKNVWISSPLTMNDPYESSVYIDYEKASRFQTDQSSFWDNHDLSGFYQLGYTVDDLQKIKAHPNPFEFYTDLIRMKTQDKERFNQSLVIMEYIARHRFNELREQYIRLLKNIVRIFSLSERNDSLLMWSHYADQHQGFCIEYDLSNTIFQKDNTYPALYTDEVLDVTQNFIIDKEASWRMSLLSSLYKAKDWQYEKEWRFTMPNNIMDKDCNISFPLPSAIFFGSEIETITNEDKRGILSQIIKFSEDHQIPRYKMALERNCFKMTPYLM